jgi:hypothetical protein
MSGRAAYPSFYAERIAQELQMSAKTLAELALKIWGVTLILGALASLPATLWMFGGISSGDPQAAFVRSSQLGYVLSVIIQILSGFAVLVWADRITALFESDTTALQIDSSGAELQILGLALVGVFVLVDGL